MLRSLVVVAGVAGCGRIDFDETNGVLDAAATDGLGTSDGSGTAVVAVKTFVGRGNNAGGATDSFVARAEHAGHAVVVHATCSVTSGTATGVTISATRQLHGARITASCANAAARSGWSTVAPPTIAGSV